MLPHIHLTLSLDAFSTQLHLSVRDCTFNLQSTWGCAEHSAQTVERSIRSRLYSAKRTRPGPVGVVTRITQTEKGETRFTIAEAVLDDAKTQPCVHDCIVKVKEGLKTYAFQVSFKRHCRLPINSSVYRLRGAKLRGDVVVMRVSNDGCKVVNMRGPDAAICDWMISK
jgi:hypothetical protein